MTDPTIPVTPNLQPVLDLLAKAGTATSEYQVAKQAGTTAKIAFWIGLVGTIAATVATIAGACTPVGIGAAAVVTIAGVIGQAITSGSYSSARADTKAAAATVAQAAVVPPAPIVNPN